MSTENQDNNGTAPAADANNSGAPRPAGNGQFRSPRPAGPRPPREDGEGGSSEGGEGANRSAGAPVRRPRRPGGKDRFAPRRRVDQFGVDGIREIDYKDFQRLRRYLSDRGKIEPRRKTGLSAFHQRSLTTAIKRARYMALLPFVSNQSR